jgi:alpha-tubulin suppressor-like RCC1 family protein
MKHSVHFLLSLLSATALLACSSAPATPGNGRPTTAAGQPVAEDPITDIVDIAMGTTHACALRRNGEIYCWGDNRYGQIGDSSDEKQRPSPQLVKGIESASSIAAVGSRTCALTRTGHVQCWGEGNSGPTSIQNIPAKPVELMLCDGGRAYGCVRDAGGRVACWNQNSDGQTTDNAIVVPGLANATALTCTEHIACARTGSNALCWGDYRTEIVGVAKLSPDKLRATSADETVRVDLPPFAAPLASITNSLRCHHRDCWGVELAGRVNHKSAIELPPLAGMLDVAVGKNHACWIDPSRGVHCSGERSAGQLSVSDAQHAIDGVHALRVAVGGDSTCAIDADRGLLCWGSNGFGQLGIGQWGDVIPTPTNITQLRKVRDVHIARRDTPAMKVAAISATGELAWWDGLHEPSIDIQGKFEALAFNGEQVCAIDTAGARLCATAPTQAAAPLQWQQLSNTPRLTQITAGGHHFCGVDSQGAAYCWGSNAKGAIGDGSRDDRASPVRVKKLTGVSQIVAGDAHSCARLQSGAVYCWGRNKSKRIDDRLGGGDEKTKFATSPVRVKSLSDAIDISIGGDTTCAVRRNGKVRCWGRLPLGDVPDQLSAATRVRVGTSHVCIVTVTGSVECWGSSDDVGRFESKVYRADAQPISTVDLRNVNLLAVGDDSACAQTSAGVLSCWGAGRQIGMQPTFRSNPQPVVIPPPISRSAP